MRHFKILTCTRLPFIQHFNVWCTAVISGKKIDCHASSILRYGARQHFLIIIRLACTQQFKGWCTALFSGEKQTAVHAAFLSFVRGSCSVESLLCRACSILNYSARLPCIQTWHIIGTYLKIIHSHKKVLGSTFRLKKQVLV